MMVHKQGPTSLCLNIIIIMIFISLKFYFLITGITLFILQGVYFSAVRLWKNYTDPWTMWGLGALTLHAVGSPNITYSWPSISTSISTYYWRKSPWKWACAVETPEFKGQLYSSFLCFTFVIYKVKVKSLSCVGLFATPWTVAYQAPLSVGFSRQEYWSGLPLPSPGDLPNPGIEPRSPTMQADTLPFEPWGKLCHL